MHRSLGSWFVLFAATALTIGSSYVAVREFVPFVESGNSPQQKLDALSESAGFSGMSITSTNIFLDDCTSVIGGMPIYFADEPKRQAVYEHCLNVSSGIVALSPSFSYAWYVQALAAAALDDATQLQEGLLQSRRTSPNQSWLARNRLMLAFAQWNKLDEAAQTELASDVIVASSAREGRTWIAEQYAADLELREVILAEMEKAPAAVQRSFLRSVAAANG